VHANILAILPRLSFYAPDNDSNYSKIDMSVFYDAWILEESNDGGWHVLVLISG
jgi:hypothetical protein